MPEPSTDTARIAALRTQLHEASDAQLRRVVAMVDNLQTRGEADALLAPVRGRLVQLGTPRPLRFERLLFLPLNPIIVAPREWMPGTPFLPRTALPSLAALARNRLGQAAETIEAMIKGRSMAETDVVQQAGAMLWPEVGRVIVGALTPGGWTAAGLPENAFASLARLTGAALRQAPRIEALADGRMGGEAAAARSLDELLTDAETEGAAEWRVILLLLLLRARQPNLVLRAATATTRTRDAAIRVATEQAIEIALDRLEQQKPNAREPAEATALHLGSTVTLLESLASSSAGPERSRRINSIRANLDKTCRARLASGLTEQLLKPLQATQSLESAEAVENLEHAARGLRALEMTGRRLGNPDTYSRLLRDAAAQVQAMQNGMSRADRARMIELLDGPDAALAFLARAADRVTA